MLRFKSLGSGSSGNATVVEATCGAQVTRLLIDCGLGIRTLQARLAQAGLAPEDIDAIFITHEHADHIGCARSFAVQGRIAVWMSAGTHAALGQPDFDGLLRTARDLEPIHLGALQVQPFTVPHDAREPLQLTCTDGDARLGVLTDLGHATAHVMAQLDGCSALLLEANHDEDLLAVSAYPPFLKKRVGGPYGHLANSRAAAILGQLVGPRLQRVVAAHLSAQNNRPDLAQAALATALGCAPHDVGVADATAGTAWEAA